MGSAENQISNDRALHQRFSIAMEILARLSSGAPQGLSIAQLASSTERYAHELANLCAALQKAELLNKQGERWLLNVPPSMITLNTVYQCVKIPPCSAHGAVWRNA